MERNSTSQITFFASLCLFLSAVEYAIPHPVPFIRLGLANLPIMLSLKIFRRRDTIILCMLKILGQALISGTIFSYIFLLSVTGSLLACLSMMLFYVIFWRTEKISWIGISIVGAMANNAGQLLISQLIVFKENTKFVAPVLMGMSLITGILLGVFANEFTKKSKWWEDLVNQRDASTALGMTGDESAVAEENQTQLPPRKRKKFRFNPVPSIITTITITIFALLTPQGKVLFTIGAWKITEGALFTGLKRSLTLVAMVFLSKLFVWWGFKFPGRVGQFVNQVIEGFGQLTSEKFELKGKGIIQAIDDVLRAN